MSGAFPALAGMNRTRRRGNLRPLRVPRTRGDEPEIQRERLPEQLRSPHSRG